jgi:NADH:ubiquinone oxidoreductase subunit F (NADH-binding)
VYQDLNDIKKSFRTEIQIIQQTLIEMADQIGKLPIHIVQGPDEYLFGEEKALLEVIENKEPLPRAPEEPPYEWGLFATQASPNPALVNNVETLAHVASILRYGGNSFRNIGTENTPGTILATLSGDIKTPGIYEVPAGTPLRELLYRFGGGPKCGRKLKTVLSGVSTGIIPEEFFDTLVDFDFLMRIGSGLGSAGFIVLDDATSIPRVAQTVARFLYVESCNQCSACKNGLRLASESLDEIFDPHQATHDDIEAALIGAVSAPQGNRCYLPVQGALLIKSLMARYPHEFERQVRFSDKSPPEWILPKMTNFDERTRLFLYDLRQPFKEPNWTYRQIPTLQQTPAG